MLDHFVLYQYASCPFCAMVRRFLCAKGVELPMRDTLRDPEAQAELIEGGGRAMVPCLRVAQADGTFSWLYESRDIMVYLNEQLAS
jgi:glutaredoxin